MISKALSQHCTSSNTYIDKSKTLWAIKESTVTLSQTELRRKYKSTWMKSKAGLAMFSSGWIVTPRKSVSDTWARNTLALRSLLHSSSPRMMMGVSFQTTTRLTIMPTLGSTTGWDRCHTITYSKERIINIFRSFSFLDGK